jgi:alkylhydroperoxidase/carboxymuconolactone decarboxylase family protein YurZ
VVDVRPEHQELLRRLALNDEASAEATLGALLQDRSATRLDSRTFALVRVAALIAAESAQASHSWAVDAALAAGASDDDIVDVLAAVAPIVGLARLSIAVPQLALALDADDPTETR